MRNTYSIMLMPTAIQFQLPSARRTIREPPDFSANRTGFDACTVASQTVPYQPCPLEAPLEGGAKATCILIRNVPSCCLLYSFKHAGILRPVLIPTLLVPRVFLFLTVCLIFQ